MLWLLALLAQAPADDIWLGGRVITLDAAHRVTQAVASANGRIVATGTDAAIRKLAGPRTRMHQLQGRTLLPGFISAHDHFPHSGHTPLHQADLYSPPIGSVESIGDIIRVLKARAAQTPEGQWIRGVGYDDTLLAEKRHPTRHDLDQVSTRHPIAIIHVSGHLASANSAALAIAKITRATPNPKGGMIRRDGNHEPTGVIEESVSLVTRHIPAHTADQRMEAIIAADRAYRAKGVTTATIANSTVADREALASARQRGILNIRTEVMHGAANAGADARTVKLFHDGSIQGYTGYLAEPYHKGDAGRGYASRSRDDLTRAVIQHHRQGRQIAIHGNGDAAIDDILHAFAEALRQYPRRDHRHRIEHCQMARPDQLDRMKELGVTPSFFVAHVYYWGDRHRDIFLGPERAARISPLATARKKGVRFTLHNDTPVTPIDPLHLIWCAVNRRTKGGQVLGPDERIDALAALRAVTSEAAWQIFAEETRGTLEVGKFADFVILDQDPLTTPPDQIKDIRIAGVVIGGGPAETAGRRFAGR